MLKHILNPRVISPVMIGLDLLLAVAYALDKDWKHVIYWLLCAGIVAIIMTF